MANLLRVKCTCGNVMNLAPGGFCTKCRQPVNIPGDGLLTLYRMGSPLGIAAGFGIYIDGAPMGHIGNKETLFIPLTYGTHNLHIASGMNRRCNDLLVEVTPQNRHFFAKVRIKPGFWTNSFVLEQCTAADMPVLCCE